MNFILVISICITLHTSNQCINIHYYCYIDNICRTFLNFIFILHNGPISPFCHSFSNDLSYLHVNKY